MGRANTLKLASFLVVVGLVLPASYGHSAENWQLSGFASFGLARLHHDDASFWGIEDEWDSETDTIIGAQIQGQLIDYWSFTAQLIAPGYSFDDRDHPFETQLEWAFVSYQASEHMRIRAGRMRTPFYLFSESLDVGYSYPWVRPPVDIYTLAISPHGTFEGVDIQANYDIWGGEFEWQAYVGSSDGSYTGFTTEAEPAVGLITTYRWDEWTLRSNLSFFNTTIESEFFAPIADGFEQAAAGNDAFDGIAALFSLDDKWINYNGLALQWDKGNWGIVTEAYYIVGSNEGLASDLSGWYISFQYQIDKFLPYVVFGGYDNELKSDIEEKVRATYAVVPAGFDPGLDAMREGALEIESSLNSSQVSYTMGVRYDIYAGVDIKFEYEYLVFPSGRTGEVIFDDPDAAPGHVSITSIVIDMVF